MARQEFVLLVRKFALAQTRPVGTSKFVPAAMGADGAKASTARYMPTAAKRRDDANFMFLSSIVASAINAVKKDKRRPISTGRRQEKRSALLAAAIEADDGKDLAECIF